MPTQVSAIYQKQEQIYEHLESCVQQEPPDKVIRRYHHLFIVATGYENPEIRETLEQLAKTDDPEMDFPSFINHCCYIVINHWLRESPEQQQFISELIKIFQESQSLFRSQTHSCRRIREQVARFIKSNYYLKLQRLPGLFTVDEAAQKDKSQPFSTLLGRYPFLFQDCIFPTEVYSHTVTTLKNIQVQKEREFELSLANYVTNQIRLSGFAKPFKSFSKEQGFEQQIPNPTLLKEPDLIATLQHFISGVEGKSTYQDLARRFLIHSSKADTLKVYKRDLYEYLTSSINTPYQRQHFNKRIATQIKRTLKEWDQQKPNEQLMLRLANSLLKFLVVESRYNINHYFYLDLVTNLGPTQTIGLLLKILLLSDKLYPYLTSRFAILYNHYENTPRQEAHWLFKSLETLNIALTIHKSPINLSYWRSAKSL